MNFFVLVLDGMFASDVLGALVLMSNTFDKWTLSCYRERWMFDIIRVS